MQHLFVYGTLLKPLRKKLSISIPEMGLYEKAYLYGTLYDLGEYPGLVLADENVHESKVYGELYTFPENYSFKKLDKYEGYNSGDLQNSEYRRVRIEVFLLNDSKKEACVYIYNKSYQGLKKIYHENYLAFKKINSIT